MGRLQNMTQAIRKKFYKLIIKRKVKYETTRKQKT